MATLDELLDRVLPLNRKERFYTGTVLPAIVCADDFAHLHRLSRLLPTGELDVRADAADCTVLFFTEYGVSESIVGSVRTWFGTISVAKDTPDIVVLVTEPEPVLIAIEAKLYDRPSRPDLLRQLAAQDKLLQQLVIRLGELLDTTVRLVHAALLPAQLASRVPDLGVPTLTWEQLQAEFHDVAPHYFDAVLTTALHRYDDLASKWSGYQDHELTGAVLVRRHLDGDETYPWMGRGGGLGGERIAEDIAADGWRGRRYQCAKEGKPEIVGSTNWFTVADFVRLLHERGRLAGVDMLP